MTEYSHFADGALIIDHIGAECIITRLVNSPFPCCILLQHLPERIPVSQVEHVAHVLK